MVAYTFVPVQYPLAHVASDHPSVKGSRKAGMRPHCVLKQEVPTESRETCELKAYKYQLRRNAAFQVRDKQLGRFKTTTAKNLLKE